MLKLALKVQPNQGILEQQAGMKWVFSDTESVNDNTMFL